jgi:hypothetical protein
MMLLRGFGRVCDDKGMGVLVSGYGLGNELDIALYCMYGISMELRHRKALATNFCIDLIT